MRKLALLPFLLLPLYARSQSVKPMTNDDVAQMVAAGFPEDVVIKAVEASTPHFDLSVNGLVSLKAAGVGDGIIKAMLSAKPVSNSTTDVLPQEAGVYLKKSGTENLITVQSELVNWNTGGVLKSSFSYGIVKRDINGKVKNDKSTLHISEPAEFIIRCPEGTELQEYQLLHLKQKGDRREFRAMTGGVFHSRSDAAHDAVEFQFDQIAPRTYRVKLESLPAGEYGFLPPSMANVATAGKIYTFGIE